MKKILLIAVFCCIGLSPVNGQEIVSMTSEALVDSTILGSDIFYLLRQGSAGEGRVTINQPASIASAMNSHKIANLDKTISGYRVRIFFDNSRNARTQSEQVALSFTSLYPNVQVYRGYENPYFKVTVGNFRTTADATKFLGQIKGQFPSGFIVKENIDYPSF